MTCSSFASELAVGYTPGMVEEKGQNDPRARRVIGWVPAVGLSLIFALVGTGTLATIFSLVGIAAETSFAYLYFPAFCLCLWLVKSKSGK